MKIQTREMPQAKDKVAQLPDTPEKILDPRQARKENLPRLHWSYLPMEILPSVPQVCLMYNILYNVAYFPFTADCISIVSSVCH